MTTIATTKEQALEHALQPLGLTHRLFRGEEDLQANVDLNNVCARADGDEWVDTIEQARHWLATYDLSKGNPHTDIVLIEAASGARVAMGEAHWWKNDENEWHYGVGGRVHPEWRRKGIGRALLRWTEARSRDIAATHAAERGDAPAFFTDGTGDTNKGKVALLTAAGYAPIRHWYTMLRSLSDPIPDIALPEGIEVRPVQREEARQITDAFDEAFRDHWGHRAATENDFQSFVSNPDFKPELWVIAWQGQNVVGGCMNFVSDDENKALGLKRGWLGSIGVRRPWRGKGVAKATIVRSFRMLRDMGLDEAGLGVDVQNPTGALQLYEGMGFRVHKSGTSYRKPLNG